MARAIVDEWLDRPVGGWVWSTLAVNALGSFVLAALLTVLPGQSRGERGVRLLLGTGLLGGFTTFSAFVMDADALAGRHGAGAATTYLAVGLASMLGAGAAGWRLGGWARHRSGGTS